ncbi:MAG: OB-fold nucleic acid binding domain-containing protein [archaeon]
MDDALLLKIAQTLTPELVLIKDLSTREGELVTIRGEIIQQRTTEKATFLTIQDRTGTCGAVAFSDVSSMKGNIVEIRGKVDDKELLIETITVQSGLPGTS